MQIVTGHSLFLRVTLYAVGLFMDLKIIKFHEKKKNSQLSFAGLVYHFNCNIDKCLVGH